VSSTLRVRLSTNAALTNEPTTSVCGPLVQPGTVGQNADDSRAMPCGVGVSVGTGVGVRVIWPGFRISHDARGPSSNPAMFWD
jgi:hypothetical protein